MRVLIKRLISFRVPLDKSEINNIQHWLDCLSIHYSENRLNNSFIFNIEPQGVYCNEYEMNRLFYHVMDHAHLTLSYKKLPDEFTLIVS